MRVRWSEQADRDRSDIVEYIWLDNPAAAVRVNGLLDAAADRLSDFPHLGRQGDIPGTRELIPHPSYRIVYDIDGEDITILAVVHTARQWPPAAEEGV